MTNLRVPVVSYDEKPLSPTTPARARKLIRDGVATPKREKLTRTFYIQMNQPVGTNIPHETAVGIDPGKDFSGIAVQTPKHTLWMGHLILPFQRIKEAMLNRRQLRRARRYRKTPQRECRFLHRTGHKLPPSIKANREMEWRVLHALRTIYPLTWVVYEIVKATGSKSFSPVMVGQQWMVQRLQSILPTEIREGWQTAHLRRELGLVKTTHKGQAIPATHAVDGIALASGAFVKYARFDHGNTHGHIWQGSVQITPSSFTVLERPLLFRRKLHVENPATGGVRKRKGGTFVPWTFLRKGDVVEAVKKGIGYQGYVSGFTLNKQGHKIISVADARWKRIGQFVASQVRPLRRSTNMLVQHTPTSSPF